GRAYFLATSFPAGVTPIILGLNGGGGAASIRVDASQKLALYDAGGTVRATGGTTLSTTTWYRIEFNIEFDISTGFITAKLYLGDSTSALETISTAATLNTNSQMTELYYSWRTFTTD